jgi:hypothetical protein
VITGTETQHWDVVLKLDQAIHGRLLDHHGEALTGWYVNQPGGDRHSVTDASGRFVIVDCTATDNTLFVRCQNPFRPVRVRFAGVRASAEEQTFTVPSESAPSARIAGQCCGPDGPIGPVHFTFRQDGWYVDVDGNDGAADGRFALGPLPPGRYLVEPGHKQFAFAPVELDLKANESCDLGVLRGERPARLTLHLIGDPAICKDAEVRLRAAALRANSDDSGADRVFTHVFPGRYRIVVRIGEKDQDAGEVELAPGADVVREVTVQ